MNKNLKGGNYDTRPKKNPHCTCKVCVMRLVVNIDIK